MKKLLLIAAGAATCLGLSMPAKAMNIATTGTQILGAATVGTIAVGGLGWLVGHYGATNTIGLGIAGAAAGAAGYVTHSFFKGLGMFNLCPSFLAANPMVAPLVVGAILGGFLFYKRKGYLSGRSRELEEFGSVLLKSAVGIGALTAISYAANIAGYSLCVPLEKLPTPPTA